MAFAHTVVTLLAAGALTFIAVADFVRARFVLANSAAVHVPESWLTPLGPLKLAGAVGLVLGLLGVPVVGDLAAVGLIAFFVGAIATHLRVGNHALAFPLAYLALAGASFGLGLAS